MFILLFRSALCCLVLSSLKAFLLAFFSSLRSLLCSLKAAFLSLFSSSVSCLFLTDSSDTLEASVAVSRSPPLSAPVSWSSCLSALAVRPFPRTSFGIPVFEDIWMGWK